MIHVYEPIISPIERSTKIFLSHIKFFELNYVLKHEVSFLLDVPTA